MISIEETWRLIEQRLGERGVHHHTIMSVREGFASGVYSAVASITSGVQLRDVSEAAGRVEKGR